MRALNKNKQKMFYSLFDGSETSYVKDENGDIIYDFIDGEAVPRENGTKTAKYNKPVKFFSSISGNLSEIRMKSWGVDQSSVYSEIVCDKGYLPIKIGTLIWRTSEVEYEDEECTIPRAESADYTVKGIMDEGLDEDCYLLQRNSSDEDEP